MSIQEDIELKTTEKYCRLCQYFSQASNEKLVLNSSVVFVVDT